ncbi:hypothetical protein [Paraburkholderia hospita]|jgi:hypothetical protein|uniref:Uncharacterized protein n=1 Tax=Paraburkholderia hospita TaxID=169430 RepID=A0AAN1MRC2_9BURK|nr:hypothetical protein [Paraburkholderia hospita]AUT76675.1 hypothetical protein C2L64_52225 [Paraburkholderia hospita]OUL80948.1 hypothetical protein CA603_30980 [Paraburkholderia hospita]SEI26018.1 hypothetical protein SAMN05192544_10657 [Paraburkholderia hospita]
MRASEANTVVANRVPFNLSVVGVHEHEGHCVWDLRYNSTTDIRSQLNFIDTRDTNLRAISSRHVIPTSVTATGLSALRQ